MADAEIIAVGSEMLTSQRLDTNSLFITDQLNALGVEVRRKLVIGDDRNLLSAAGRQALLNADDRHFHGRLGPYRGRPHARSRGRGARPSAGLPARI